MTKKTYFYGQLALLEVKLTHPDKLILVDYFGYLFLSSYVYISYIYDRLLIQTLDKDCGTIYYHLIKIYFINKR